MPPDYKKPSFRLKAASLYLLITLFWLISMYALVDRHYGHASEASPLATVTGEMLGEKWMGIYREGERIGYSTSRLEKMADGYKSFESVLMRLKLMGEEKEIRMLTDSRLDGSLKLKSFVFYIESDVSMSVSGAVEGKTLLVTLNSGGVKSEQRLPMKDEPYISLYVAPELLKEGESLRLPIMDPATLTQDVMELKVAGKESLSVMGKNSYAFRLEGSFKGTAVTAWVSEKGEMLKEESAGFTFIREAKEDALKIKKPSSDFVERSAVPLEGKKATGDLNYLKVRFKGINLEDFELDGGSQRLSGDVLEIWRPDIKGIGNSVPLSGKDEYLKDTLFIQAKDPEIAALAGEITKGGNDDIGKARLIYEWVYKNIKKTPAVTIPSAKEVLKSRRGDCNEHTTLYTALSRAAGVPTRIAVGLVYKEGYFYYHAWPEIYIAGWIPIDPTLGQFPADAGHIRLLTGDIDRQAQILSVVGKLRIERIEK